jgi:hypothetical protein
MIGCIAGGVDYTKRCGVVQKETISLKPVE